MKRRHRRQHHQTTLRCKRKAPREAGLEGYAPPGGREGHAWETFHKQNSALASDVPSKKAPPGWGGAESISRLFVKQRRARHIGKRLSRYANRQGQRIARAA
jgi:hypothetical protein